MFAQKITIGDLNYVVVSGGTYRQLLTAVAAEGFVAEGFKVGCAADLMRARNLALSEFARNPSSALAQSAYDVLCRDSFDTTDRVIYNGHAAIIPHGDYLACQSLDRADLMKRSGQRVAWNILADEDAATLETYMTHVSELNSPFNGAPSKGDFDPWRDRTLMHIVQVPVRELKAPYVARHWRIGPLTPTEPSIAYANAPDGNPARILLLRQRQEKKPRTLETIIFLN